MRSLAIVTVLALVGPRAMAAPAAGGASPSPATILAGVDASYAAMKTARIKFEQTSVNKTFGTTSTEQGRAWIARPDQLRWEYQRTQRGKKRVVKVFVADATTVTMIDHLNLQVAQQPVATNQNQAPAALAFLTGRGALGAAFTPALAGASATTYTLELTPTAVTAATAKLTLVVDAATYAVRESTVEDSAGNTNRFVFSIAPDVAVNPTVFDVDLKSKALRNYRVVTPAATTPAATTPAATTPTRKRPRRPE